MEHRDGGGVRIIETIEHGRDLDQLGADLRHPVVQEWLARAPKWAARRRALRGPAQPPG
jgi:hypothetical protein